MTNSLTCAALAALCLWPAAGAGAQITTVIAPARRPEVQRVDSVRRVEAARDSVARVTLTDMKVWVDSAASALAVRPDTAVPADSAVVVARDTARSAEAPTGRARGAERPPRATDDFPEAAPAPDTATSTPALALTGGLLIVVGALVLRRRRTVPSR